MTDREICEFWNQFRNRKVIVTNTNPKGTPKEEKQPLVLGETNDYYELLNKNYKLIGMTRGIVAPDTRTVRSSPTTVEMSIYVSRENGREDSIAIVRSFNPHENHETGRNHLIKVDVATYYKAGDKPIIINHFDQNGPDHVNDLSLFGDESLTPELETFYKHYLTNTRIKNSPLNCCTPHLHFYTRNQVMISGYETKSNAISLEKLLEYVRDLSLDNNPEALINTNNMGMPFIAYKNAQLEYFPRLQKKLKDMKKYFDFSKKSDVRIRQGIDDDSYKRDVLQFITALVNTNLNDESMVRKVSEMIGSEPIEGYDIPTYNDLDYYDKQMTRSLAKKDINRLPYYERNSCLSELNRVIGLKNLCGIMQDLYIVNAATEILQDKYPEVTSILSEEFLKGLISSVSETPASEKRIQGDKHGIERDL